MHECSRCYGCMASVTSDIHHVAHTYANPIVVSVLPATGRAYTMLQQTEWCYSERVSNYAPPLKCLPPLIPPGTNR